MFPPELGPADEVLSTVRDGVERIEAKKRAERTRTGDRVVGRANVLALAVAIYSGRAHFRMRWGETEVASRIAM